MISGMPETAENLAREYAITREQADDLQCEASIRLGAGAHGAADALREEVISKEWPQ